MRDAKDLRYRIMLALYFPILLYAVSTFDVSEDTFAVEDYAVVTLGDRSVVVGEPFQARTFLSAQSLTTTANDSSFSPRLIPRGNLSVRGDSLLTMDTQDLLAPSEERKQVSYEASYEVPRVDGTRERVPVSGSFTVRRPEIVAKTEVARALYRRTLNRLRLSVPGIDNRSLRVEGPERSATGASLPVSPTGDQVTVDVYLQRSEEDLLLGQREFSVIDPPRPQISVFGPQGEIASGDPIQQERVDLRFEVEPDPEFENRHPEDANYEVAEATVFLRRGQTASEEVGKFDLSENGRLVLTQELQSAESGDQVIIRLGSVVRINHEGRRIEVPLRENSRTFGFILS